MRVQGRVNVGSPQGIGCAVGREGRLEEHLDHDRWHSLGPGMAAGWRSSITIEMSSATRLVDIASARSARLLADVEDFDGRGPDDRVPILDRLAAVLGRDFAERIVAALSNEALERLDAALTPAFANRLASALAKERDETA